MKTTLLSTRAKEAIKTGLAMVIVYAIALGMGWENPRWAGFAVAMISLSTAGQSMQKGILRMLGTFVAAAVALTLIALFAQERWWFMVALSIYLGFCTYMLTGKTYQYFWYVGAFVCLIIAVDGGPTAESAFQTAVLRTQQTGMGILVYSLVSIFLWPQSSVAALKTVTGQLFETQRRLFQVYRGLISAKGTEDDGQALRMQEVQLLSQFAVTLGGAETESYEVWEVRRQWHVYHQLSTDLGEALERWRASFPEVQQLDMESLLPDLQAVYSEVDARFAQIERMLAGEAPTDKPRALTLEINQTGLKALTHLQKAAVATTKTQLDRLEMLSRSMFDTVAEIKEHAGESSEMAPALNPRRGLALDPDRLLPVFRVIATLWIAFLIWVYIDPPGHAGFVQFAGTIAMATVMMPQARPISMVLPFTLGCVFAGVLYVFVMPQLSNFWQLAIMIFGATFAIYYLFSEPRQGLAKIGAMIPVLVLTSIQNEQTYDFAGYANSTVMIILGLFLMIAVTYLPPSPRPEKTFLRLLKRFFRHADFMLSRLTPDAKRGMALGGHLETALYRNDLLDLPDKLAMYGRQIDHKISPENAPEQIQAIVNVAHILAHRIKMLEDAAQYPQSDLLIQELRDDVRAWRSAVQAECRSWARDPERATRESAQNLEERFAARLERLETSVNEVFARVDKGRLKDEDYENFYRYLGSLRGVSEAGIEYARLAEHINWAQWREERF